VDDSPKAPEEETGKKRRFPLLVCASLAAGLTAAALVYFLVPDTQILAGKTAGGEQKEPATAHVEEPSNEGDPHSGGKQTNSGHGGASDNGARGGNGGTENDSAESKFRIIGAQGVFSPEPLVVSIKPIGRVRYLKLGYVVETSPEFERIFIERENRLRDTLNIYLRAVDVTVLEDPASMGRIRSQIARRVAVVMDPAPVHAVLITDFILS